MTSDPGGEDEFIDIRPWPVQVLVGRLVSLVTLGRRGILEAQESDDLFEAETDRFDLESWAALELQTALAPDEARILHLPVSSLNDDDLAACADALLAADAIGWALRVIPSGTLTIPVDASDEQRILEWSPKPWTRVWPSARSVRLRSDEELAHEREKWDIVTWRLSLFQDPTDLQTDRAALRDTIAEASAAGLLHTDGDDLLTDAGASFAHMTDDELSEIDHLARIRLRTLNWVCGFGEDWESAPLFLDD
ncbi:MAG: hypothetical protein AVDCRST_MAG43-2135 [uncultured Thermomicrobiales bacterium]|uniref:DUF4272 domain-containing protein n=1 Tax=uncultured Thermomicrobiales bacterium TaxID=1645740 RepID=A0A6J4V0U6_9BACT|nr:MAG: hypothetical protein AVDCRST_MAG43-2135 [uncultured Thermomicrobiales bacterium]